MLAVVALSAFLAGQVTPVTVAAELPESVAGRGAEVRFLEVEAENGVTNGRIIGPDLTFGSVAAEASGRRAVQLSPGQHVEVMLAAPADGLTIRYALPDAPGGGGLSAGLDVSVDGAPVIQAPMSSRYNWYYGRYPFTRNPADAHEGRGHHVFDHVRLHLPQVIPTGGRLRLTLPADAGVEWAAIDLIDYEQIPAPIPAPAGALSVLDFGADPTGETSSADAFDTAIAAGRAQGRPVFAPEGRYQIERHVLLDRVALHGAGVWRTVLTGDGVGLYGEREGGGPGRAVTIRDLAIFGRVDHRDDHAQVNALGGGYGDGSLIENLWLQHVKVGAWLDGPFDGLTMRHLRIFDVAADGINLRNGVSNALVEHVFVRGAGDDGLALWSNPGEDRDIVYRRNTVIAPTLANGIAVYGGRDITVEGNLLADTLSGGGIHLGARFEATPFQGVIRVSNNAILRSGVLDPNWRHGVGALWLFALDKPIAADIRFTNNRIVNSAYPALHVVGQHSITGLRFDGLDIDGAGDVAFQVQAPGEARFDNVTARGVRDLGVHICGADFVIRLGAGDHGWAQPRQCKNLHKE
ncbi:glycosyl hydrolase family 28-related protein [Brevundimonas nasdae]|uniref:glycosyl hydrolase family 28-related protein n=1 Tax=Brevundimonas nasdae TaxID=172043 RepID=UPI003F691A3A